MEADVPASAKMTQLVISGGPFTAVPRPAGGRTHEEHNAGLDRKRP